MEKHNEWMKSHGGQKFQLEHVAPVVEKCLDERVTVSVIKSAFEKTGIYEFNKHKFDDGDFYAAEKLAEAEARASMTQDELAEAGLDRCLLVLDEEIPVGIEAEVESNSEVASTSGVASASGISRTSSINSNLNEVGPIRIVGQKKVESRKATHEKCHFNCKRCVERGC